MRSPPGLQQQQQQQQQQGPVAGQAPVDEPHVEPGILERPKNLVDAAKKGFHYIVVNGWPFCCLCSKEAPGNHHIGGPHGKRVRNYCAHDCDKPSWACAAEWLQEGLDLQTRTIADLKHHSEVF
jgi:hypothetical protein